MRRPVLSPAIPVLSGSSASVRLLEIIVDILFFAAIIAGLIEGLVQYLWIPLYFKFGVPILVIQVPALNEKATSRRELVVLKHAGREHFLLRQKRYGIARYAYYHGLARVFEDSAGRQMRCILFVDWNVLLFGALIFCAMFEFSRFMAFLGVASGIIVAMIMVGLNRKDISLNCRQATASQAQV